MAERPPTELELYPFIHGLDESVDQDELYKSQLKHRPTKPKRELPQNPPPEMQHQVNPIVIWQPPPGQAVRHPMLMIEADDRRPILGQRRERLNNATRLMWLREPGGLIRTLRWQERRYILRVHRQNQVHKPVYAQPGTASVPDPRVNPHITRPTLPSPFGTNG